MQSQVFDSVSYVLAQTIANFAYFLPRITGALLALVIGIVVAKIIRRLLTQLLDSISFSKFINKTPLQFAFNNEVGKKAEEVLAGIVYWLVMLVVIQTTVSILGITALSSVLEKLLAYIPRVLSAALIFALGVLLAGWVESAVKSIARTFDASTARLLGKFSSYMVVIIVALASLAELGIASNFINMIFFGLIAAVSLAGGLAIGLGSKDLVSQLLSDWYKRNKKAGKK
ncbi:MAG: mechanosensitive ion channel family protein [Patescibacteria group bacterium]